MYMSAMGIGVYSVSTILRVDFGKLRPCNFFIFCFQYATKHFAGVFSCGIVALTTFLSIRRPQDGSGAMEILCCRYSSRRCFLCPQNGFLSINEIDYGSF